MYFNTDKTGGNHILKAVNSSKGYHLLKLSFDLHLRQQIFVSLLCYVCVFIAVNVDSSTGTAEQQQDIEIKFNTASMSYAERLLLKKHRRTDVDALFSPREGSERVSETPRMTPRQRSGAQRRRGPAREKSNMSLKIEDFNDGDFGRYIQTVANSKNLEQPGLFVICSYL